MGWHTPHSALYRCISYMEENIMERHLALQASSSSSSLSSERDKVTSLFVSHKCSSSHLLYFTVPFFSLSLLCLFLTYDLRYKTSLTWHTLSSLILSCPVLSFPVLSCPVLSCPVLSSFIPSCHVMSCHVMSCHVMSCHVLSCPILSHLDLSCSILSCFAFWRPASYSSEYSDECSRAHRAYLFKLP